VVSVARGEWGYAPRVASLEGKNAFLNRDLDQNILPQRGGSTPNPGWAPEAADPRVVTLACWYTALSSAFLAANVFYYFENNRNCPVRTFCGKVGGGFFRYGLPHFLVKKLRIFRNLWWVRTDKRGGGDQFFAILCGRLLWTAPIYMIMFYYQDHAYSKIFLANCLNGTRPVTRRGLREPGPLSKFCLPVNFKLLSLLLYLITNEYC